MTQTLDVDMITVSWICPECGAESTVFRVRGDETSVPVGDEVQLTKESVRGCNRVGGHDWRRATYKETVKWPG